MNLHDIDTRLNSNGELKLVGFELDVLQELVLAGDRGAPLFLYGVSVVRVFGTNGGLN